MNNEKAPETGAIEFDNIKIVPTEERGCFRTFVNGVEDKMMRNIKIEMGVDNRTPLVTIEKYCESVEGDFGKCLVASTFYRGNPEKYNTPEKTFQDYEKSLCKCFDGESKGAYI